MWKQELGPSLPGGRKLTYPPVTLIVTGQRSACSGERSTGRPRQRAEGPEAGLFTDRQPEGASVPHGGAAPLPPVRASVVCTGTRLPPSVNRAPLHSLTPGVMRPSEPVGAPGDGVTPSAWGVTQAWVARQVIIGIGSVPAARIHPSGADGDARWPGPGLGTVSEEPL